MKKKKSRKPSPAPEPRSSAAAQPDLKTLIREHSLFFDRLVDLIPARFYLPAPDADDRPWYPGLSKQARASAKKLSRENTRKSRRVRLDPDASSSTLDALKSRSEAERAAAEAALEVEGAGAGAGAAPTEEEDAAVGGARSVTYEELRERLHRRIEELRSTRNTRPSGKPKKDEGDRRKGKDKGGAIGGKRKREDKSEEQTLEGKKRKKKEKAVEKDPSAVDLSFGHVKIGSTDNTTGKKKKRLSKMQALEKAKQLEEAKKDPEKGEVVSKKHSWKTAVSRAAGVKVHDDPNMLKKSIKKEKKRHQKNAEKWKERMETTKKLKTVKQKTRDDNIKERIHQKKMKKIEKREKKLMRPGFEGRKEGYVNEH